MTFGSNIPIWGLAGGIAGPLLRMLRDRLTPPQKGLRYFDLDIKPAPDLAHLVADSAQTGIHLKPYTHFIRLSNYGREIIDATDYIRPFRVEYQDGTNTAQLVGYRIIRDIRSIHPRIYGSTSVPPSILIQETLNPGDRFTLGVLLAVGDGLVEPDIDCRIKGIARLNLKWHHKTTSGPRMLRRLVAHYFAFPLAVLAGLALGVVITLVTNPNAEDVRRAIAYVFEQFGAGLLLGLLLGGLLVALFEFWEYLSFRSQRRSVEATFRRFAHERLDQPLPSHELDD